VNFEELLFCEANGNYVTFHLPSDKILSRMTLSEVENILPKGFIKTHRSFIVNSSKITKIERHQVTLTTKTAPVSSTYYDTLMQTISL